jgi:hypothetical protein
MIPHPKKWEILFIFATMTEKLFNSLFTVGDVIELDHKVAYSMGLMYGKIWVDSTDKNTFPGPSRYIGIYDNDYQGVIDVSYSFDRNFFNYFDIKPVDLYRVIKKTYESNLSK